MGSNGVLGHTFFQGECLHNSQLLACSFIHLTQLFGMAWRDFSFPFFSNNNFCFLFAPVSLQIVILDLRVCMHWPLLEVSSPFSSVFI